MDCVFIIEGNRVYVVFPDAFNADMHEAKFNPAFWERCHYYSDYTDVDKSKRGNAYRSQYDDGEAFAEITHLFGV